MQRVGIDAARQHLARGRHHGVVGASQAGNRIQKDHHVTLVLDQALGLLDHHLGNLNMAGRRLVESRRNHFALYGALHVGNFFRPLVDQKYDQINLRVIGGDRLGDIFQNNRLAGARRRGNQRALSHTLRRHDVDHPAGLVLVGGIVQLHLEPTRGMQRRQVVEMDLMLDLFGIFKIDGRNLEKRKITFAVLRRANRTFHRIAGAKAKLADLRRGNVNVVRTGQIVRFGRT